MKPLAAFPIVLGLVFAQACSPAAVVVTVPPTAHPSMAALEAPPTDAPTGEEVTPTSIDEIAGIWDSRMLSERGYHEFRADGTLILGYTIDQLRTNPVFTEPVKYWFQGDVFHIEDSCGHGTYHLTLYKEDGENRKLTFHVIEDPCEQRISDWQVPMRWFEP